MTRPLVTDLCKLLIKHRPQDMTSDQADLWIRQHVDGLSESLVQHFGPWFVTSDAQARKAKKEAVGGLSTRAAKLVDDALVDLMEDLTRHSFKRGVATCEVFIVALTQKQGVDKQDRQRLSSAVLGEEWWIDTALSEVERRCVPWLDARLWPGIIRDAIAADLVDPGFVGAEEGLKLLDDDLVWERLDELDKRCGAPANSSKRFDAVRSNTSLTDEDVAAVAPSWPVDDYLERWPEPARSKANDHSVPSGELDVLPMDEALRRIQDTVQWRKQSLHNLWNTQEELEPETQVNLELARANRTLRALLDDAQWWLKTFNPSSALAKTFADAVQQIATDLDETDW